MQEYGRLRELRYEARLSQQEVADMLHCTQVAYSLYESGKRKISIARLAILARFYETSIDYMVGLVDERKLERNPLIKRTAGKRGFPGSPFVGSDYLMIAP